ncbi:MAG: hypothetical protein WBA97_26560 [Actinophytocola sp.]|uniref:hypothetical protein n=1 Tax=Actinophytocola sp. TaxID=1872138 RepID=UPI003C71DE30
MDAPVSRRHDPRALRYIVDHVPPGTLIQRHILVTNKSSDRRIIEVYPGAAAVQGERFRFGEGRAANDLTSWIGVERPRLDLAAGEEAKLAVTIQVPPKASSGERYAVLWASTVPAAAGRPTANVTQIQRVGIRIYLDVGPGGEPASSFTIGQLMPARDEQGHPSVAVHVDNTGGRALDLTGSATLSDGPAGMAAGPFAVKKGTTLGKGQSGTVTVWFPRELPNGPWTIRVELNSGTTTADVTAHISFPDPGMVGEPGSLLTSPWLMAGFALPLAAGLAYLIHRRTRGSRPGKSGQEGAR